MSEIELEIGAGPASGGYLVRVLRSPGGGEPAGTLDLDIADMLARHDLLEATVLASAVPHRSVTALERPVREAGQLLFEALFHGRVYGAYRASLGATQRDGKPLRLVLRLTAPELAALPWEMLFDQETETYLCRREPLVRHISAPYPPDPLPVSGPLRILGVIASPKGFPVLDVESERAHLSEALAEPVAQGLVELAWASSATWATVHAQLLGGQWHVLHFIGHGEFSARSGQGAIALTDNNGWADLVPADKLADLLGEAQPAPRLVVLNSCSSARTGAIDLFSSAAAALASSGIGAVAAMQFAISDGAAIAFARGFYTAIANGRSVDQAARSGRISILGTPHSLEWVTPVLYLRGQAAHLFRLTPPASRPRQPEPKAPPAWPAGSARTGRPSRLDPEPDRRDPRPANSRPATQRSAPRARPAAVTPEPVPRLDPPLRLSINSLWAFVAVSWHPDGRQLAAANRSNKLRVYRLAAGQDGEPLVLKGGNPLAGYNDVAFSGDGSRLATGSTMTLGQIWDPAAGRPLLAVHHIFTRQRTTVHVWTEVHAVAFSPDGTRLVTGSSDHTARIWNARTGSRMAELRHDDAVLTVAWGQDGDLLATGGLDKVARIWHAASGQSVHQLGHGGLVQKVAFSPDGGTLATASADKTARIWAVGTGEQRAEFRHDGGVRSVAFSPDGRWLATGSADQNVRICDLRAGRRPLELRHNSAVNAVAFSPDGTRLAAAGGNSVVIWDVAALTTEAGTD